MNPQITPPPSEIPARRLHGWDPRTCISNKFQVVELVWSSHHGGLCRFGAKTSKIVNKRRELLVSLAVCLMVTNCATRCVL